MGDDCGTAVDSCRNEMCLNGGWCEGTKCKAEKERTYATVPPVIAENTVGTAVFGAPTVERLQWMMVTRCVAVQTNGKVNNVTKMSTNAMTMTVSMIVCLDAKCAGTYVVALSVTASRAGKVTTAEQLLTVAVMKCA